MHIICKDWLFLWMNFSSVLNWGYRYEKFLIENLDVSSWQNGQNPQLYLLLKLVRHLHSWKPYWRLENIHYCRTSNISLKNSFQWESERNICESLPDSILAVGVFPENMFSLVFVYGSILWQHFLLLPGLPWHRSY